MNLLVQAFDLDDQVFVFIGVLFYFLFSVVDFVLKLIDFVIELSNHLLIVSDFAHHGLFDFLVHVFKLSLFFLSVADFIHEFIVLSLGFFCSMDLLFQIGDGDVFFHG